MIIEDINDAVISQRLAALRDGVALHDHETPAPTVNEVKPKARLVRPCAEHLESWITWAQDDAQHYTLGMPELDVKLRGFRPGEFVLLQGFSQSGKSQVLLNAVMHHLDRPFLWVTYDEAEEMVVAKLVAMLLNDSTARLEEGVKAQDDTVLTLLRDTARERMANFYVMNESVGLGGITRAIAEIEDSHGESVAAVSIDYLSLIPQMKGEDERSKAIEMKGWVTSQRCPVFVIHQNTRGGGGPGEPVTMTSGRQGGEDAATTIIGARRKRDWREMDEHERSAHQNTISISIVKNKRTSWVGEFDYYMNPNNGLILPRNMDPEWIHTEPVTIGTPMQYSSVRDIVNRVQA